MDMNFAKGKLDSIFQDLKAFLTLNPVIPSLGIFLVQTIRNADKDFFPH